MPVRTSALTLVFSLPILTACGPTRVTAVYDVELDCSIGIPNCGGTWTVEVSTDLPAGTILDRAECDEVCRSMICRPWRKGCVVDPRGPGGLETVTCGTLGDVPPC